LNGLGTHGDPGPTAPLRHGNPHQNIINFSKQWSMLYLVPTTPQMDHVFMELRHKSLACKCALSHACKCAWWHSNSHDQAVKLVKIEHLQEAIVDVNATGGSVTRKESGRVPPGWLFCYFPPIGNTSGHLSYVQHLLILSTCCMYLYAGPTVTGMLRL
jgi:hypothetical protein